jgi:tRNA pseudouridine13 synthase
MLPIDDVIQPPLLTHDLRGLGGKIKTIPEDFEVEEIPAYEPSGQGDFLYLWMEKRDLGAEFFTRLLARQLDIPVSEIGTAGLKDRHAVARQMVSVPASAEPKLAQLEGEGIHVLRVSRHTNKLRAGHLHGNRFRILIREPSQPDLTNLPAILDRLREHGLPNYYGTQRFGHDGETLNMGLALLRGEKPAKPIRSPFLKKLALSAAQSGLFNHYLAQRLRDGLLRRVLPGDVMCKVPFGGMFVVQDVEVEQKRFDARKIVTAGPIFGRKTFAAAQEAAQRESSALTAFELSDQAFAGFGKLVQGTRRHNLVYLNDLAADVEPDGVRLRFTLPAGSYATVLLREIMKADLAGEEDS